jgi:hypothetical protein
VVGLKIIPFLFWLFLSKDLAFFAQANLDHLFYASCSWDDRHNPLRPAIG